MKATFNVLVGFLMYGIVGGMELGSMGIKRGIISLIVCALVLLLVNKKRSAVSRKYNGQAHKVHNKNLHKYYTPNKGGVSSGL